MDVVAVDEARDRQAGHEGARLEADREPFAVRGAMHLAWLRFRAVQREQGFAGYARDHELPVRRRYRQEGPARLAVAGPDALDEGRVRWTVRIEVNQHYGRVQQFGDRA